jgi:uncharacterized protein (TIGR00269 family)
LTNCVRCGKNAIYTRKYSGESLCGSCFKSSIVEKVRRTLSKYEMLKYGEKVAVAVSGGKDSLSLLEILHSLAKNRYDLVAITVDEGVRGYREEAIEHARSLVESLGIRMLTVSYEELYGFTLDDALSWKDEREISSCSFCGVFRRRAIDEAAARAGVDVVATAHNLDDYAQTRIMNLLNGGVERIAWQDPRAVDESFPIRRVKPFLEVYEEEIALYAYLSSIPFQSVSCPYMHEGIRSEVRDFLNKMEVEHPGMKHVLLRSALEVSSRLAGQGMQSKSIPCSSCGRPSSRGLCNVCTMKKTIQQHSKYTN